MSKETHQTLQAVLGIDVGGTNIKLGLFTPQGELIADTKVRTPRLVDEAAYQVLTDAIVRLLKTQNLTTEQVIACGLDIPGPVDDKGCVGFLPNISLNPEGLVTSLSCSLAHAKIAFINDANAAALGEMWAGSAHGVNSFVFLALGTGVGGGIVSNGQLIAGSFGNGGEVGHITVCRNETRNCGCGRSGCLEQYTSATGIVNLYLKTCAEKGVVPHTIEHPTDTLSVFKALSEGDDCAQIAVNTMCDYLGYAMAQIACVVDPKLFLIGGGVAGAFAHFAPELRRSYVRYALSSCKKTAIEAASLGNQAAMYGCAYSALQLV